MKILKNRLKSDLNIRTEMDFPTKGIEFVDINPLILQKETLSEIVSFFVNKLSKKKIDYIVAPEARGFLFGMAISDNLNCGCIPVRKKGKLPPSTVAATFDYEKEYGRDTLELPKLVNEDYSNKNFYIVDDIYATGNTVNAISDAIKGLRGNIIGVGAVINIVELNNNKEVFSLIDINES
jgi:adenine phosphoribosyltransferase